MRTLVVCITGAAGSIAYSLYNTLFASDVFGTNLQIKLRLIDVASKIEHLELTKLQIEDSCYTRVCSIELFDSSHQAQAFKDADVVIFLGSQMRSPGMDKEEVIQNNARIFQEHGFYLDKYAKKSCRSVVVSNPPNTLCLVLASNAPSIPQSNFTSLTRLDYNRFLNYISNIFDCKVRQVKNLIIWGNHSKNLFCDPAFVTIQGLSQEEVKDRIKNINSRDVEEMLYDRGGFIADKRKSGAYMSAAMSITDHLRDWFMEKDKVVSMGVILSQEAYNIPNGLCFSVPVVCGVNGSFKILQSLQLSEQQINRLKQSSDQLMQQRQIIQQFLYPLKE